MPYARIADLQLHYERVGEGPRLLLIPGTGSDLRRRPSLLDTPLGARFDLLTYDHRGMGQSDKPDRPCRIGDYACDALALMDAVGWDSARVLGVSFGGMVAQELALRAPHRVERLALACTSAGGAGGASFPLHTLQDLSPEERARRLLALDSRRNEAWQADHPEEAGRAIAEALARGAPVDEADADALRAAGRRQLEARRVHDTFERLPQLNMPVVVLGGRYDLLAPPSTLQAMAERIPAPLQFFEGGHNFLMEDPSAIAAAVQFLGEGPPPGAD